MTRLRLVDRAKTPDGGTIELTRDGSLWVMFTDGRELMSSDLHGSEEAMARLACDYIDGRERPRVLVGGLGFGFTLRAALDVLPADAEVVCVELLEATVSWNRGQLGDVSGRPLDDPRVRLVVGDVTDTIRAQPPSEPFDVILLDVDNGPVPMTVVGNWWLYAPEGIAAVYGALGPGGVLAVWSNGEDGAYVERLEAAGFFTEVHRVAAWSGRRKGRSLTHVFFIGQRD